MTKFKLEKEVSGTKVIWKYRNFRIKNVFPNHTYPTWVVKQDGVEVYRNGNGTRKQMIEWVDGYYQDTFYGIQNLAEEEALRRHEAEKGVA
tara:strand:+ start:410 stop:682 length:273 start_codon:yes stop_codon:yes gene_type:complete